MAKKRLAPKSPVRKRRSQLVLSQEEVRAGQACLRRHIMERGLKRAVAARDLGVSPRWLANFLNHGKGTARFVSRVVAATERDETFHRMSAECLKRILSRSYHFFHRTRQKGHWRWQYYELRFKDRNGVLLSSAAGYERHKKIREYGVTLLGETSRWVMLWSRRDDAQAAGDLPEPVGVTVFPHVRIGRERGDYLEPPVIAGTGIWNSWHNEPLWSRCLLTSSVELASLYENEQDSKASGKQAIRLPESGMPCDESEEKHLMKVWEQHWETYRITDAISGMGRTEGRRKSDKMFAQAF